MSMVNDLSVRLTTKADHNRVRREPIPADTPVAATPGERLHPTACPYFASKGSRFSDTAGHPGGLATSPSPLGYTRANADTLGDRQGLRTVLERVRIRPLPGARWAHVSGHRMGVCDRFVGADAFPLVAALHWMYMLQPDRKLLVSVVRAVHVAPEQHV